MGNVWLYEAIKDGPIQEILAALDSGVDPDQMDEGGLTALLYAAIWGHTRIARELLRRGANANVQHEADKGWTPLHYAAHRAIPEFVELLLQHGARPDVRDDYEQTPLNILEEGLTIHPNDLARYQSCHDLLTQSPRTTVH